MSVISKLRLKQYLDLNLNVLMIGLHGVGKTSVIKEIVEEAGLRWKYFSASTLDPWVDFVGVPKVVEQNNKDVLKLVRPLFIENDEVEFIFFDEFNRAPDKVINAVMELIQFRSINGHQLKNLKVIWAAINPEDDDDTYSVNHLDPAQLDRFPVHYHVPYKVDKQYFRDKYPAVADSFITWWEALPENIQKKVSPRRLDYAADAYVNSCRLEDFLPKESNVKKLRDALQTIPFKEQLDLVKTDADAEAFMRDMNNSTTLLDMIKLNDPVAVNFFMKFGKILPSELTAPFVDFIRSQKFDVANIKSLDDMINRIPDDKGDQRTVAIINNTDFSTIYKSAGSLETDLRTLANTKHNAVAKLANRCVDIIITLDAAELKRAFWVDQGLQAPTNLNKIMLILSRIGGFFTPKQRQFMNKKLFDNKITPTTMFL